MNSRKYGLVSYAFGRGGTVLGCSRGPQAMIDRGLLRRLKSLSLDVVDYGSVDDSTLQFEFKEVSALCSSEEKKIVNLEPTYRSCRALSEKVSNVLADGRMPIVLGGDHSLSIGSVAGVSNHYQSKGQQIGLIWIDSHPDINIVETSPSLKPYGMSVAILLGRMNGLLSSLQKFSPAISKEHLVFIGLRDVDPGEKEFLRQSGIKAFSMKEIDRIGLAEVTRQAIDIASKGTAGFVASFDLDVCDPEFTPAIGTPVRGGLTYRESHLILEMIADSKGLLSFEMLELNPRLDKDYQTTDLAIALTESALGRSIL